ncbi:MAG: class I SAM-dependent methyltransferase [bacterium]|nr:class I SAM-dependent methyltransferase [bacterium]MBU1917343.1 class I SAM-dependent methyltransferase [bacterium]
MPKGSNSNSIVTANNGLRALCAVSTNALATGVVQGRTALQMNARYHEGLIQFRRRCTDNGVISNCISSLFTNDSKGLVTHLSAANTPRIADIGCGDGMITSHLLSQLCKHLVGNVLFDVIEPEAGYIQKTEERIKSISELNRHTTIEFRQAKAEEFFDAATTSVFNFIFSSHSLHLISLEAFKNILKSLVPGGYLVVVIGAKTSVMSELKDLFVEKPTITGSDISETAHQLPHNEFSVSVEVFPSVLCLEGVELPENFDDLTEEAKNLLSLLVQANLDTVGQAGYEKARAVILKRENGSQLVLDNDLIIIRRRG